MYYTSIMILCWLSLGALSVLVRMNSHLSEEDRRLLWLTYALVAAAALAEWIGVQLSGRETVPHWLLRAVKCADYILTPMAGGALMALMGLRNRWEKAMMAILAVNTVLQLIALTGNWMITIDAQNRYVHGPLYPVYILLCLAIFAMMILQFALYGRSHRQQNRTALYAVMPVVLVAVALQELLPDVRTAYLGMTIGAALMFIHYAEFAQVDSDDTIARQALQMQLDPLTGLLNRYAYSQALKIYAESERLPEDYGAFTIDINGLKQINDELGHEAGDELIKGAAECITEVFKGSQAQCFRTGGDEFVVLSPDTDTVRAYAVINRLEYLAGRWQGSFGQKLSMSVGFALERNNPGFNAEELIHESDLAMYAVKADYYRRSGRDRRRSR
ncbi:MAG: GGDEF domain-containing protein [Oscillospiraceae bacterium]|nr:GGDEF domain-containing protein [Oscillospiraceae bacterium]MBQ2158952.1 GGDEF domain-containing protein [Oscillospiraceae bacterium]